MDWKKTIILSLLSLTVLGAMYHGPVLRASTPPPVSDPPGTLTGGYNYNVGGTTCDTAGSGFGKQLNTTQSPDLFFAVIFIASGSATLSSVAVDSGVVSSSSVQFSLRQSTSSASVEMFEYTALVKSTVTDLGVTFSWSPTVTAICLLFAVSGIDPTNPFDNNPSLPVTNSGNSTTASGTFYTSQPTDMLVLLIGVCKGSPPLPAPWNEPAGLSLSNNACGTVVLGEAQTLTTQNSYPTGLQITRSIGSDPWATIADAVTIPRGSLSTGGCGLFPGGVCNPSPVSFQFQSSLICPLGNGTLSIGCYSLPSQLTNPLVPYLVIGITAGALASTFIGRDYLENRDRRRSLV